jgi:ribosomally synthesized peptide (two-chain TOMM family)
MNEVANSFPTYLQFLEYRAVIIQAIAAAWQDPSFLERLKTHPRETLQERFGYHYPFKLDLKVQPDSSTWTPTRNGGWTTQHYNSLDLVLPPAPQDKTQFAAALAAYNAKHISILTATHA